MQATINDVAHNTATAFEIAHFTDGRQKDDPMHVSERLYRQHGGWFLRRRQRGREAIVPMTPDDACKWLREKRFDGALVTWFGEKVERQRGRWVG